MGVIFYPFQSLFVLRVNDDFGNNRFPSFPVLFVDGVSDLADCFEGYFLQYLAFSRIFRFLKNLHLNLLISIAG
jgi:hypothetical protein